VFIGSGVTIGDGAIVGANSLVVKDVAPYSIVAGNPSRLLRFRFSSEIIDKLIQISWWTWDDNDIQNRVSYLLSPNIEDFISVFF
jgi:tetrahydrodipicolinate N-succinyltransferase